MKAIDVMVRDVVTVTPDTEISEAARLLVAHDVSALPVIDAAGAMVGILSEADLMRRAEIGTEKHHSAFMEAMIPSAALADEYLKSHSRKVGDLMTRHVISAFEDTSLEEIATILERNRIKRVPILRDGRLVGIVSRANLIQALASASPVTDAAIESDRAIRGQLIAQLKEQPWTDFGNRNIIVTNGSVHLWGLVGSDEERSALVAAARNVPGVATVVDEMIAAY